MMYVFCDIDHCLSDAAWRDPMIGGEGGWDAYHNASIEDKPIQAMVLLVNALYKSDGCQVVGLTSRPYRFRQLTIKWLLDHHINLGGILMRPDNDYRPSHELKPSLVQEFMSNDLSKVAFILDDREDVIKAFAAMGVTALHVYFTRNHA